MPATVGEAEGVDADHGNAPARELAETLIRSANDAGGSDNVTVAAARFSDETDQGADARRVDDRTLRAESGARRAA